MATNTPNFGLYKYEGNDAPDLTKLSTSMDKIDTELKKNETNIGLLNNRWKMEKADVYSQSELDAILDDCFSIYGERTKYSFHVGVGPANLSLPHGGEWLIEGATFWSGYEIQTAKSYWTDGMRYKERAKTNGVWSAWRDV